MNSLKGSFYSKCLQDEEGGICLKYLKLFGLGQMSDDVFEEFGDDKGRI